MSALKKFKNKLPVHQRRKEVITLTICGLIIFSTLIFYRFIIYSPIFYSEYPIININCNEELSNDYSVDCTFELNCKDPEDSIDPLNSRVRIRGSGAGKGASAWPKKGYRLELTQAKSLLGLRKDDDWILFAMYVDYPRMRIKMSLDLWRSLEPTNPTAILPDSEYVCLYMNGEFQGLYLLAEKNDRRLFGLDDAQNNIDSSLVFQYRYPDGFGVYDPDNWEQDWPNEDDGIYIMDDIMANLVNFIHNTSDEDFFHPESGIYSKFHKRNLVDFYVYNFFILHQDFWNKNLFIVRNTNPNKFYLVPWDFDRSFGQYIWKSSDPYKNIEQDIRNRNEMYARLLDNESFVKDCNARWNWLREELWTDEFIFDMLTEIYKEIKPVLEIDTQMWDPYQTITDKRTNSNQVDESVSELYQWIKDRLDFCDTYFA